MNYASLFVLITAIFLGSTASYAQQASTPQTTTTASSSTQSTIDPATFAAAKELIVITKSDQTMRQILPILTKNLTGLLTRDNPQKADLVNKLMDQYFIPTFMSHLNEFQDQIAIVYANNLTLEDMKQLIAFYKGPTGQKYLQVMPVMAQQSMQLGMVWGQKIGREAAEQLVEQLRKNNMNVPKEIGL